MPQDKDIDRIVTLIHRLMSYARHSGPEPWTRLNLTREQLRVLFALSEKGSSTPGEIAALLKVSRASMTGLLSRMEGLSLIERKIKTTDRRSHSITLSARGREKLAELREVSMSHLSVIMRQIPPEGLHNLRRGLESVLEVIETRNENGHHQNQRPG